MLNGPFIRLQLNCSASATMTLLLDAPSRGIGVVGTESLDGRGFPMVYLAGSAVTTR